MPFAKAWTKKGKAGERGSAGRVEVRGKGLRFAGVPTRLEAMSARIRETFLVLQRQLMIRPFGTPAHAMG